uniref:Uncharacterized protein n=1 Tax=Romanomermis culicivorax TaxID=13658 RepID=A0A915JCM7_ROMCU
MLCIMFETRNDPKLTIKSTTNQPPPSKICKTPKLNAKMKSLSLDCPEFSKIHSRLTGISSVNSSPTPNRRSIRVPPCEDVNAENDMLLSNVKCKPLTMLPNSQFAVVHNNRAKYAGECELRYN